jgi:hypothetical protein
MGYAHIDNLYKNANIRMFRECYAMEKVHGTSANVRLRKVVTPESPDVGVEVIYYAGGASHDSFVKIFDEPALKAAFLAVPELTDVTVYGEAYGGKLQGMSDTYGKTLKFIAFDVLIGERWLSVESASLMAQTLGFEFVPYERISTDQAALDAERDRPSRVAVRRGITEPKISEGVVLRPVVEVTLNNGTRICAKHKRVEFSERASKKDTVADPGKLEVLKKADEIAKEWVTPMRLQHVTDKLAAAEGRLLEMKDTGNVIRAMVEDVLREGAGEIEPSKEAERAIGAAASKLFRTILVGG